MRYLKPSYPFRAGWVYNGLMYTVLSYLPTVLLPGRVPFTTYVKREILDPLGMHSTTHSYVDARASGRLADGIERDNYGRQRACALSNLYPTASNTDYCEFRVLAVALLTLFSQCWYGGNDLECQGYGMLASLVLCQDNEYSLSGHLAAMSSP